MNKEGLGSFKTRMMNRKSHPNKDLKAEILEHAPVLIAFHDVRHHIIWANKAYRQTTGVSLEQLGNQKCYHIWGLKKPCQNCPVIEAMKTGLSAEAELIPETQDHWPETQGSWLVKAVPVMDS